MRKIQNIAVLALVGFLFIGCNNDTGTEYTSSTGGLEITIQGFETSPIKVNNTTASARTIAPEKDILTATHVLISLEGPHGEKISKDLITNFVSFDDLNIGAWKCTVEALNSTGTVLYTASQNLVINPFTVTSQKITLAKKQGETSFTLIVIGGTEIEPYSILPFSCAFSVFDQSTFPDSPEFIQESSQTYILTETLSQGNYMFNAVFKNQSGASTYICETIQIFADIPLTKTIVLDSESFSTTASGTIALLGLWFDTDEIQLQPGMAQTIRPLLIPGDATTDFTWSSSSGEIASVDETGLITAISTGSAFINITDDNSQVTKTIKVIVKSTYEIGDRGPSGGYIFYDAGEASPFSWRYLECAPKDLDSPKSNSYVGSAIITQTKIGAGESNTDALSSQNNNSSYAEYSCTQYCINGVNGWFLPSSDELKALGNVSKYYEHLGIKKQKYYKSSSQIPNTDGYYWYSLYIDDMSADIIRTDCYYANSDIVRPIRSF